ncbi:hypothetical protein E4U55_007977 [Claviceps digitariae]|nr:hypothetical protein E4U55_007977 [Claviceps digitariae]
MEQNTERQLEGVWNYGRYYSPLIPRKYLWPIDEWALDGMDIFHKFYLQKLGKLFRSPLKWSADRTCRVLDLGTGTGIWSFDVAEFAYKEGYAVKVMAIDINMIQPSRIPREVTILQQDLEQPSWGPSVLDNCDLVHLRHLNGSIRPETWGSIYRNAFLHLSPGRGFIEHVEIDWVARWCEEVPQNSPIQRWCQLFRTGVANLGRSVEVDGPQVRNMLAGAGFVRIREVTTRCFLSLSLSRDAKKCEKWLNGALQRNIKGWSMVPLIEGLGYTREQVDELCEEVIDDIIRCETSLHFVL